MQNSRLAFKRAGVNHSLIKGHSFRRGGETWLSKMGVPMDMIKSIGWWASDAVYRYVDSNFDVKLLTMKRFGNSIASHAN